MAFHKSFRRFYRRKTNLRIKGVCIAGGQNPAPQVLQRRMPEDALHQPLPQPAAAMRLEHENISDIRDSGEVADYAGKSNLLTVPLINPKTESVLDRPGNDFSRNAFRPITIGQETVNHV